MIDSMRFYIFFLKEKTFLNLVIILTLGMVLFSNNFYFDGSRSMIQNQTDLELFAKAVLTSEQSEEEIFDGYLDHLEMEEVFLDKGMEARDILFNDLIIKLKEAITKKNLKGIYKANQYIYLIRLKNSEMGYGSVGNNKHKIYPMIKLKDLNDLDNNFAIGYYNLLLKGNLPEANFFIVVSKLLTNFEILSPFGILFVLLGVILFLNWEKFKKKRSFFLFNYASQLEKKIY